jgi:serine/threonine-protein kinase
MISDISSVDRSPVGLLAEEFAERLRRGERPSLTEYTSRYPEHADEIRELFPALAMMEQFKPEPSERSGTSDEAPVGAGRVPGRLGDFRILREVGRGGMGVVYEAEQESLGRHVALKILLGHALNTPQSVLRFRREAKSAARLHHTNIVPVFGVGEQDGAQYYVMQFIHGRGLDEVIQELKQFRPTNLTLQPDATRKERQWDRPGGNTSAADLAFALATGLFAAPVSAPDDEASDAAVAPAGAFGRNASLVATTEDISEFDADRGPQPGARGKLSTNRPRIPDDHTGTNHAIAASEIGSFSGVSRHYWREVARVGVQVARALEFAHTQGILHRDIKPSNLLIDLQGAVWVADFGLAKAIADGDLTHTDDIVGTLRYMAPERFRGDSHPESDVYSLGATLYELLTLRPAIKAADRASMIDHVLHTDPPPPRSLDARIPRDLETIVVKAMAKHPADRYSSARALAEDLDRFLQGCTILARRSGVSERLWRWSRRNPVVAVLGALVFALTMTLATSSTVGLLRLRKSYNLVQVERSRAEDNFKEARLAVDDSFTRISESLLLDAPGVQPLRKQLLEGALKFYRGFVQRLGGRAEVRAELAAALDRVARITAEIGSKQEALGYQRQARAIYESLLAAHPSDARLERQLARSIAAIAALHGEIGRPEEAVSLYHEAMKFQRALVAADAETQDELAASESGLGWVLEPLARPDDAIAAYQRAAAIRERLIGAFPESAKLQDNLAQDYRRAARLKSRRGHDDEALALYSRSIAMREALVKAHPEVALYRVGLAGTYTAAGITQRRLKRVAAAIGSYQKARGLLEALVSANPSVAEHRFELAAVLNSLANIEHTAGRADAALRIHRQALELRESLVDANPRVVRYQYSMAASYNAIGEILCEVHRHDESIQTLERLKDRMQQALAVDPKNADARFWLSCAWNNIGDDLMCMGQPARRLSAMHAAVEHGDRALAEGPKSKSRMLFVGTVYLDLAAALRDLGRPAQAAATLWEHRALLEGDPDHLYRLACGLSQCVPLVARDRTVLTSEERAERGKYGDWALDALRQAIVAGYRDASRMSTDADLDPIRERDVFRDLVADLVFPSDPFAQPR